MAALLLAASMPARAADKSGVKPQVLSLPSGPGSIQGLGESFEPQLNTGAAAYRLAIAVPPGRAGHTPDVTLQYSSGMGNGHFGIGWHLALQSIQRQTDKSQPTFTNDDEFVRSNGEELINLSDGSWRDENESGFERIRRVGDGWEATDRSGKVYRLGTFPSEAAPERRSRVELAGSGFDGTFRWLVDSIEDTVGNRIEYVYDTLPQSDGELYLRQIRYNHLGGAFQSVEIDYEPRPDSLTDYRSGKRVQIGWRGSRIRVLSNGGLVREYVMAYSREPVDGRPTLDYSLLTEVRQFGSGGVGTSYLPPIRFEYSAFSPGDQDNPPTGNFPGLEDIDVGADGNLDGVIVSKVENAPLDAPITTGDSDLADVNADGLPDLLRTDTNPHTYYPNLGRSRFGSQEPVEPVGLSVRLGRPGATLADIDGDGRTDLVNQEQGAGQVGPIDIYRSRGDAAWSSSVRSTGMPLSLSAAKSRLLDVDFDKAIDVIQSESFRSWQVCLNGDDQDIDYPPYENFPDGPEDIDRDGDGTKDGPTWSCSSIDVNFPLGISFDNPEVQLADLNGDRLQDIVWLNETGASRREVWYWPGKGRSGFDTAVIFSLADGSTSEIDFGELVTDAQIGQQLRVTDANGDGLADLLWIRSGTVRVWLNLGGSRWSPVLDYPGTPEYQPGVTSLRLADMNGNGSTDLLYIQNTGPPEERWQYVDLAPGPKANQLVGIDNGLGRRIAIQYRSSIELMVDARDGAGSTPWSLVSPTPMSVVSRVVTTPSVDPAGADRYVTDFVYRDAYYDGFEKEFRGFAFVKKIERGDTDAPTLVTRLWFHTGAPDGIDNDGDGDVDERTEVGGGEEEALKGKLLAQEVTVAAAGADSPSLDGQPAPAGAVFRRVENDWRLRAIYAPAGGVGGVSTIGGRGVIFAFNTQESTALLEIGRGTARTLVKQMAYDDFGNVTKESDLGSTSRSGDERYTCTEYAVPKDCADCWLVDRPAQTTLASDATCQQIVRQTVYFYDGEAYVGLPKGELTRGLLTREQAYVSAGETLAQSRSRYDQFGNVTGMLDGLGSPAQSGSGHLREMQYDPVFAVQPVRETIHVGGGAAALVMSASWDLGLAVMTSSVDFNGNSSSYGYDVFGRLTSITKPGDSPQLPTSLFSYRMVDPFRRTVYDYDRSGELALQQGVPTLASRVLTRAREVSGQAGTFDSADYVDGMGRKLARVEEAETGFVVKEAVTFNARGTVRETLQPYASASFEYIPPGAGDATTIVYDATGRETVRIHPAESAGGARARVETSYAPLQKTILDELQNERVLVNDGLDRLIQVDEVNAGERYATRYEYNPADSLTRITDAQNNVRRFVYDGLQRKTLLLDPDRGALSYEYDDASNLRTTIDARGQRISYDYDGVNRLLSEDYAGDGTLEVQYHYDTPRGAIDLGDGRTATATQTRGLLAWVEDLSGEEHISYDERARQRWVVKRVAPGPGKALTSYQQAMAYDALDRVTSMTYPDGDRVAYEYNSRSLLERILGGPSGAIVSAIDYTASGQMMKCSYGNGVDSEYTYDPRLRMRSLRSAQPQAPANALLDYTYDFDPASNILRINDRRPASVAPVGSERRNTQIFTYDDLYRLTGVRYSFAGAGQPDRNDGSITYAYDRIGNLISQTSTIAKLEAGFPVADLGGLGYSGGRSNRSGRASNDPPGPHALTTVGSGPTQRLLTYDPNGNVTSFEGKTLTWDVKDRLIAVETAELRAEYLYDYTDRRIQKRVSKKAAGGGTSPEPPEVTTYINRFFEIRENEEVRKYVFNGETRVARISGTLDPSAPRVQRLRISPGWNLLSLSVDAPNAVSQLGLGTNTAVEAIFRWDPDTRAFLAVSQGGNLAAGSVFWLRARAEDILEVRGTPSSLPIPRATISGAFLPVLGALPLHLESALPPSIDRAWVFDAVTQGWRARFGAPLNALSNTPDFLSPGEALFVRATTQADLVLPDEARAIQYYHQDHLGSSDSVVDSVGELVESNLSYPFGHPRSRFRSPIAASGPVEPYAFTQKEVDRESGLYYFEARSLHPGFGRFLSPDPALTHVSRMRMESPGTLNGYSYASNRPIVRVDPDGRMDLPTWEQFSTAVGYIPVIGDAWGIGTSIGEALNKQLDNLVWVGQPRQFTWNESKGAWEGVAGSGGTEAELRKAYLRNNVDSLKSLASGLVDLATSKIRPAGKLFKGIATVAEKVDKLNPLLKKAEAVSKVASRGIMKVTKNVASKLDMSIDFRDKIPRAIKESFEDKVTDAVTDISIKSVAPTEAE